MDFLALPPSFATSTGSSPVAKIGSGYCNAVRKVAQSALGGLSGTIEPNQLLSKPAPPCVVGLTRRRWRSFSPYPPTSEGRPNAVGTSLF